MKKHLKIALLLLLLLLFMVLFAFSSYHFAKLIMEYREGKNSYKDLQEFVTETQPAVKPESPSEEKFPENKDEDETEQEEIEEEEEIVLQVDFATLSQENEDCVGWIYQEGSVINYPIMQDEDNQYYLTHLYNGVENIAGSIFLDFRNSPDFSDRHTLIHGHRMNNGSMFTSLNNYAKTNYFERFPFIEIITPERTFKVQLFSAYSTTVDESAWKLNFPENEFELWLEEICAKSAVNTGIKPRQNDHIVTFSTCTSSDELRFVVHGRILDE